MIVQHDHGLALVIRAVHMQIETGTLTKTMWSIITKA